MSAFYVRICFSDLRGPLQAGLLVSFSAALAVLGPQPQG
jgi:hypothetical protein